MLLSLLACYKCRFGNWELTWKTSDVHLLQVFGLQDDDGQFSGGGNVAQWETDITQLLLLWRNVEEKKREISTWFPAGLLQQLFDSVVQLFLFSNFMYNFYIFSYRSRWVLFDAAVQQNRILLISNNIQSTSFQWPS